MYQNTVLSTEGVRIWLPDRLSTYLYFTVSMTNSYPMSIAITYPAVLYQCLIHVYGTFLGRDRNRHRQPCEPQTHFAHGVGTSQGTVPK